MFARFDENPAMTLRVIKETKRYGRKDGRTDARTDGRTDGQRENSIPPTNKVCGKHYIKSHLELQREITLIELAPSPYFFVSSICLAYMNMFARFDENPAMTLRVIKEKALY